MDLTLLLIAGILILDFVISVWNAYAAGFSLGSVSGDEGGATTLVRILSYLGLALGFAGAAYVVTIVLGAGLAVIGYLSSGALTWLMAFDFLVFGGLITGLGIMVTVESVVVAAKTRNWKSVLVAGWNVFASFWNVFTYVKNFGAVSSLLKSESRDRNATSSATIIVIIAVAIALLITYSAYRFGRKQAGKPRPPGRAL